MSNQHIRKGNRLPRLSFDMDGVLADFVTKFIQLVNEKYGTDYKSEQWIDWNGPFTPDQMSYGWNKFLSTPNIWTFLPHFNDNNLSLINDQMRAQMFNGYVVTRRSDITSETASDATAMTKRWLHAHGITEHMGLVCGHYDRVALLKMLEIDAHIDDTIEEWERLNDNGITCYLIDRPFNRSVDAGILRVNNVNDFVSRALSKMAKKQTVN